MHIGGLIIKKGEGSLRGTELGGFLERLSHDVLDDSTVTAVLVNG